MPVKHGDVRDGTMNSDVGSVPTLEIDPETLEAEAQTAAGVGVPVEDVLAWIESWDTPDELPMPVARKLG